MRAVMLCAEFDTVGSVPMGKAPSVSASPLDSTALAAVAAARHNPTTNVVLPAAACQPSPTGIC